MPPVRKRYRWMPRGKSLVKPIERIFNPQRDGKNVQLPLACEVMMAGSTGIIRLHSRRFEMDCTQVLLNRLDCKERSFTHQLGKLAIPIYDNGDQLHGLQGVG